MFGLTASEDDDDFCKPVPGTNLASLFDTKMNNAEQDNVTLTYSPPKQPNSNRKAESHSNEEDKGISRPEAAYNSSKTSGCLIAKAVIAHQLIDESYSPKGRLGFAILQVYVPLHHKLILYNSDKKTLSSSTLNENFTLTLQGNNYVSFYDDQKCNWSILFSSAQDYDDFLAKYNCINHLKTQEIYSSPDIYQTSNSEMEKLNNDEKNVGLDTDSDLQKSTPKEDATKAAILNRMVKMGQAILLPHPNISKGTNSDSSDSDSHIAVLRERLKQHPQRQKVPKAGRKSDQSKSRSETTHVYDNRPINVGVVPMSATSSCTSLAATSGTYFALINGQLVPIAAAGDQVLNKGQSQIDYVERPSYGTDNLSVYFAENRTHNSELRMKVTRLSDKLDKVLEKIEYVDEGKKPKGADASENSNLTFTTDVFQKLLSEYKTKLEERSQQVEELQRKLGKSNGESSKELQHRLNDKSDQLSKLQHLHERKLEENERYANRIRELEVQLSDRVKCVQKMEVQNKDLQKNFMGEEKRSNELKTALDNMHSLEIENDNLKKNIQSLEAKLKVMTNFENLYEAKIKEVDSHKENIATLNESVKQLNDKCSNKSPYISAADFETKIKSVMNYTFKTIAVNFEIDESYSGELIRNIIGSTIKATTINFLNHVTLS